MITNEVQYRATKAHLERFEAAAAKIEARRGKRTKLEWLELDAMGAQADDLRAELADFGLSAFQGWMVGSRVQSGRPA
jgi:hypothetical protein